MHVSLAISDVPCMYVCVCLSQISCEGVLSVMSATGLAFFLGPETERSLGLVHGELEESYSLSLSSFVDIC